MSSIKIILRKSKPNTKGEYPLYIQIIHNRLQSEISLKVSLPIQDWDVNKYRVKRRNSRSIELNGLIQNKLGIIHAIQHEFQMAHSPYTAKDIIKEYKIRRDGKKTNKNYVVELLEAYVQENPNSLPDHTLYNYNAFISCLKVYDCKITFQRLNHAYFNKYIKYLKETKLLAQNTVWSRMKFFRKAISLALTERIIEHNPMLNFKVRKGKPKTVYLIMEELKLIEDYTPEAKGLIKIKDMFLFMCYTGLRISDLCTLKKDDIENSDSKVYMHIKIRKTAENLKLLLSNKAISILKTHQNFEAQFIFSILNENKDLSTETKLKNEIKSRTAYYNKAIKKITQRLSIEKNVSMHKARSTFATITLSFGTPLEVVSKLLGHSSIKETQIYAKIIDDNKDKAIELWNDI